MPIYDFKCKNCGDVLLDEYLHYYNAIVKCKKCGKKMTKLISAGVNAKCFPQDGLFLEHVSATGKRFHSTKELRTYERKHDVELGCLL